MEAMLNRLADSVSGAQDLESLTRPILELLETVTGMESTYLTTVDTAEGVQHILYARNTRRQQLEIPEGLSVPWGDTLCKRALDEGKPYTDDVSGCWGDSDAARALGIRTYLSQPVLNLEGSVYGTLCAASGERVAVDEGTLKVLGMFARLIAHQVAREQAVLQLRQSNEELSTQTLVDPLTGIANRRGLMQALRRMLAQAAREGSRLQVAFIDLDGFKVLNDTHGHDVGDRYLRHVAQRLGAAVRAGDVVARYGGDEFVVVTPDEGHERLGERLEQAITGPFVDQGQVLASGGGSVGVVASAPGEMEADALLARADAAMYEIKKRRRAGRDRS